MNMKHIAAAAIAMTHQRLIKVGMLVLAAISIASLPGCIGGGCLGTTVHFAQSGSIVPDTFIILTPPEHPSPVEFKTYASLLSCQLEARGFSVVSDLANARYEVDMTYGIGGGTTTTGSVPIYGQTGGGVTTTSGSVGGTSFSSSSFSQPTYGQIGSVPFSRNEFQRHLVVKIIELKKAAAPVPTYESRTLSSGSSNEIAVILPAMIIASFKGFDGPSGETLYWDQPLQSVNQALTSCRSSNARLSKSEK